MRWAIVIAAAVCTVAVAILAYGKIAVITRDEQDWRRRELAFLTSVHNRMQAELANTSEGMAASLRREDDSILQAMAAVAKPMSADSVPNDVRALLPPSGPSRDDPPIVEAAPSERSIGAAALPAGEDPVAGLPPALAPGSEPAEASSEARLGAVVRAPEPPSPPPVATAVALHPQPQLEAALHPEKTDRGLRVMLPTNALFGEAGAALDPALDPLLSGLAELTAAMQPREIVVIGPSAEEGATIGLSKDRVHAVAAWLKAHGPKRQPHLVERIRTRPAPPNNSAASPQAANEREQNIEVLLRRR